MRFLTAYRLAGRAAAPILGVMLRRRAARGKEILLRLGERRGMASMPRPAGRLVWVHAASVGETMSVLPVIEAMRGRSKILLTTGTVTSAALAAARLPDFCTHQFVPLDVPGWVERFLLHWRPDAAVFLESELWPGMLAALDERQIPRFLLNARMSARSAANWARVPGLAKRLLGGFVAVQAQSAGDAAHFSALGQREILEWGNLKFCAPELPVDAAALEAFCAGLPGPVWLAASTHPGEEEIVIAAHRILLRRFPALVTVIVPRHPERGSEISRLAGGAPRRSLGQAVQGAKIYVADTLGELGLFFRAAPFAFIGNSLVGFGGHNVIEPALLGRAVLTGPHNENFAEAAGLLAEAGALREVRDAAELAAAAQAWLADPADAAAAGAAARKTFRGSKNLPARLAELICESLAA